MTLDELARRIKYNVEEMVKTPLTPEIKELLDWVPAEMSVRDVSKATDGVYFNLKEEKDACYPFFSEGFLYNALGKEDARSLLSRMRSAFASLGVDVRR